MSEPRKLHTESAYGASQDQYEKARRLAQQQAAQNARRRIQRPGGRSTSTPPRSLPHPSRKDTPPSPLPRSLCRSPLCRSRPPSPSRNRRSLSP